MRALALILILSGCAQEANTPLAPLPERQTTSPAPKQEEKARPVRLSDEQLDRMGREYARHLRVEECPRDVGRCPRPAYRGPATILPALPNRSSAEESYRLSREMVADDERRELERRVEQIEMDRHLDVMARLNRRPI